MAPTFPTNGLPHASQADEGIDALYAWWPGQAQPTAPLPEAAFSLTLKGTLDGHEALLTARGMTAAEFTANLQAIRGLLDAPAATQTPQGQAATPQCPTHGVAMRLNHGKDGRTWYSHKTADGWCKGR